MVGLRSVVAVEGGVLVGETAVPTTLVTSTRFSLEVGVGRTAVELAGKVVIGMGLPGARQADRRTHAIVNIKARLFMRIFTPPQDSTALG